MKLKSLKKLNRYNKAALGCVAGLFLLMIGQLVFVLLPIYSIDGTNSVNADAVLDRVELLSKVLSALMVLVAIASIVLAVKGSRVSKKPAHDSQ